MSVSLLAANSKASNIRANFENLAKEQEQEGRRKVEAERAQRAAREQQEREDARRQMAVSMMCTDMGTQTCTASHEHATTCTHTRIPARTHIGRHGHAHCTWAHANAHGHAKMLSHTRHIGTPILPCAHTHPGQAEASPVGSPLPSPLPGTTLHLSPSSD